MSKRDYGIGWTEEGLAAHKAAIQRAAAKTLGDNAASTQASRPAATDGKQEPAPAVTG